MTDLIPPNVSGKKKLTDFWVRWAKTASMISRQPTEKDLTNCPKCKKLNIRNGINHSTSKKFYGA